MKVGRPKAKIRKKLLLRSLKFRTLTEASKFAEVSRRTLKKRLNEASIPIPLMWGHKKLKRVAFFLKKGLDICTVTKKCKTIKEVAGIFGYSDKDTGSDIIKKFGCRHTIGMMRRAGMRPTWDEREYILKRNSHLPYKVTANELGLSLNNIVRAYKTLEIKKVDCRLKS